MRGDRVLTGTAQSRGSELALAVDDDPAIRKLVEIELPAQGFEVLSVSSGQDALRCAQERFPDIVVLDLMLSDMSGFEVMRGLRRSAYVPVVMLSARTTERDRVRGLELGADDYLVKPFSPDELGARMRAVLRRTRTPVDSASTVQIGDVEVDLDSRTATRGHEFVPLTRTEWSLLSELVRHAGKVMTNNEILTRVWGPAYADDLPYLRVWISRLRSKLDPRRQQPGLIRTFPGIGYMLVDPVRVNA